jgi:hypothetical protein
MANTPGLLVPVDLTGYCLGEIDAVQAEKFAGATTSYSHMGKGNATLGSNVTRSFDEGPNWSLEAGAHLHWAMPDALTHGKQGEHGIDFAALPNRWLLTRVALVDGQAQARAWVILSDALSSDRKGKGEPPSLPVKDTAQDFRYLGVAEVFDGNWQEPLVPNHASILALFGSQLHAVASGDASFAAYYPNSRNVFGFYDDLKGVDTSHGDVTLMYTLAGWYADASHDPLHGQPTLEQLQADYQWTCANYPTPAPDHSIYHGLVQQLVWNPTRRYIEDSGTPVKAKVAIGNHPAEALAAYFNGLNGETRVHFDALFTAFEIGALSELMQPQPGQWSALKETLHTKQFNALDGGTIFQVQPVPKPARLVAQEGSATPPLPPGVADELNLLNQYQQEWQLAGWEQRQYYGGLFASWYRIVQIPSDVSFCAENALGSLLGKNPAVEANLSKAQALRDQQKAKVAGLLPAALELVEQPAPAFHTPCEPTLLVSGDMFDAPRRYGGDGRHHEEGMLACRTSGAPVASLVLTVGGVATPLPASRFSTVALPSPNHLAYADDINALLMESCLLNTGFAAALLGADAATLEADQRAWLAHEQAAGNSYQSFNGTLPSPVAVQWLDGNPWLPMFLSWQLNFHPFLFTRHAHDPDVSPEPPLYGEQFFNSQFKLDPNGIGYLAYAPGSGAIDPAGIDFRDYAPGIQLLKGSAILSPSSSDTLQANLERYLQNHQDSGLQTILKELRSTTMLMQALGGLNAALLMGQEALQLKISAHAQVGSALDILTRQMQRIITDLSLLPTVVPDLNGYFNPLRAGYFTFSGKVVDAFGQMRPLQVEHLYLAETMAATYQGKIVKDVAYLQPRLVQPARLLFRWLAADSSEYEEMNFHPATTPVCGWLLTNHLNGGLFIYDQYGRPLGSLLPSLDKSRIVWQPAAGDDTTIGQTVEQVMRGRNPHLAGLVLQLAKATPAWFGAFWRTVDSAAGMATPPAPSSDVGLGALVGRPLALAQASLLLEQQGIAASNLGWDTMDKPNRDFIQTDNGLSDVQFPVVLGHLEEIDDGLIGYFKLGTGDQYDYGNFYSDAAKPGTPGVQPPALDNLWLTPHADMPDGPPSISKGQTRVLLLLDPRAGVHVSSGILPTQFLQIPAAQFKDVLRSLEMAFPVAPVLLPANQVALPLGAEKDYSWSWIEQGQVDGAPAWLVTPDIATPSAGAVWTYSPQQIGEGWLRLNPQVLRFELASAGGQRAVRPGGNADLVLTLTNLLGQSIGFAPASLQPEGHAPDGAIIYLHFGRLVRQQDVAAMRISAPGWQFEAMADARYGHYWAATPAGAVVTLASLASLVFTLSGVPVDSAARGSCTVYFDYYRITGIGGDGVAAATLGIETVDQPQEKVRYG